MGGFGIARSDDPLRIDDVRLVQQTASPVTVEFDDDSVADLFDELVDAGLKPSQFARVWIHTHPGDSATPSGVDETTFDRCFGGTDWSVMAILAREGATYARLRFHVGPGGELRIPVKVDWTAPFGASDHAAWNDEYQTCVRQPLPLPTHIQTPDDPERFLDADWPWPEWERFEHESQPLPSPQPQEILDVHEF